MRFAEVINSEKLDRNYLLSGAIFPDMGMYVTYDKNRDDFTSFIHEEMPKSNKGLKLGLELIKNAKTKEELSFALGVYSHFVLDKNVHTFIYSKKFDGVKHLWLEFYKAHDDLEYDVNAIKFPKAFFIKTFAKVFAKEKKLNKYLKQIKSINWIDLLQYNLESNWFVRRVIRRRYGLTKKGLFFTRLLMLVFRGRYLKRYNVDIMKYLDPDVKIKKYLPKVNELIKESETELKGNVSKELTLNECNNLADRSELNKKDIDIFDKKIKQNANKRFLQ